MYFFVLNGEYTIAEEKPCTADGMRTPYEYIEVIIFVDLLIISITGSVECAETDFPKIL